MQLIKNNPYRMIGLLAGSTAREQDKQIRRLKQYLSAEQEPEGDYSFPSLGKLDRSLENVIEAASKLNLDNDKITAAMFWFYNGNAITDDPAFESLRDGNVQECTDIWLNLTASGEITKRNSSAFHNLSTLLLCNSFICPGIDEKILEKAISFKLKFLESEYLKKFIVNTTDETYKTTKNQLQLIFLQLLHSEIEKHGGISSIKYLEIVNKYNFSAKDDFIKEFISKPIEQIERNINEFRTKRKTNNNDAIKTGNSLYIQTKDSLSLLKSVIGSSNNKYIAISDKVSEEILQCGIDYFKQYKDSQNDPSQIVMNVLNIANSLACGNIAKQRCTENIENLKEWIKDKPERDKNKLIDNDLKVILEKHKQLESILNEYKNTINNILNIGRFYRYKEDLNKTNQILNSLNPLLQNIKSVLGNNDELYLKISNSLSNLGLNLAINVVNAAQDNFNFESYSNPKNAKNNLLIIVVSAVNVINLLKSFDMDSTLREHLTKNSISIENLRNKLEPSGCYIATMVYGSYNHPQVLILRQFRDEVLNKSTQGQWFIKTYYHYSPMFVKKLKDHKITNILIRKLLNQIIKLIEP